MDNMALGPTVSEPSMIRVRCTPRTGNYPVPGDMADMMEMMKQKMMNRPAAMMRADKAVQDQKAAAMKAGTSPTHGTHPTAFNSAVRNQPKCICSICIPAKT